MPVDVLRAANIDRTYMGKLERAKKSPTLIMLDRLAEPLGIKVGEVAGG
jgi:transcriptional regulator with XRE-family HTH domain